MKKVFFIATFLLLTVACQNHLYQKKELLNGFWVIETVILPNQEIISYSSNPAVDYIEFTSSDEGYRKKAYPQFDGTYQTTENCSFFKIKEENEKTLIYYRNEKNKWSEELLSVDKNHFSVKNHQNIRYNYKRYEPY